MEYVAVKSVLRCYIEGAHSRAPFSFNPMSSWPRYPDDPTKYLHFKNVKASINNWIEEREDNKPDLALLTVLESEKVPPGITDAIICCSGICPKEFTSDNYPIGSVVVINLVEPSKTYEGTGMANFIKNVEVMADDKSVVTAQLSDVVQQTNTLQRRVKVKKVTMLESDVVRFENYMLQNGVNSWKAFNELLNTAEQVPF